MRCVWFFLSCFCLSRCSSKKGKSDSGVVRLVITIFDNKHGPGLIPVFTSTTTIWHQDSIAIEQINRINIQTDPHKNRTVKEVLDHFVYLNFSTKSVYYYKSFSDTAAFTKKRMDIDSISNEGAWNFFKADSIGNDSEAIDLPDTVIDHKTYKRMQCSAKLRSGNTTCIISFDCSRPDFLFNLDEKYRRMVGCPVVKIFASPKGNGNASNTEVKIVRDSLLVEELKIFEAWRKNERSNID